MNPPEGRVKDRRTKMADVSLIQRFRDPYDSYQFGRAAAAPSAKPTAAASPMQSLLDDTTEPVTLIDPQQQNPAAFHGIAVSAMGMDQFMPNGGSAVDQLNNVMSTLGPYVTDPNLTSQLLGLQGQNTTPTQEDVDGAMAALRQNYDVDAGPVALFKQLNPSHSGYIQPWELTQAVMAGGGTIEQASALMKELDPFGNGQVSVQNMIANLPGQSDEQTGTETGTGTSVSTPVDNSALGGLTALGSKHDLSQPLALFDSLDSDFDGIVSQSDVINAVTSSGGTSEAGAALYAQLDPAGTGAVDKSQFLNNLYPRIELPSFFA
jgi:Ca2+-binding EF-hand superfamily protein